MGGKEDDCVQYYWGQCEISSLAVVSGYTYLLGIVGLVVIVVIVIIIVSFGLKFQWERRRRLKALQEEIITSKPPISLDPNSKTHLVPFSERQPLPKVASKQVQLTEMRRNKEKETELETNHYHDDEHISNNNGVTDAVVQVSENSENIESIGSPVE